MKHLIPRPALEHHAALTGTWATYLSRLRTLDLIAGPQRAQGRTVVVRRMSTSDPLLQARGEAVSEVCALMFKGAGEAFLRHGDDPQGDVILAAALRMFIDRIDAELFPKFRTLMMTLLQEKMEG